MSSVAAIQKLVPLKLQVCMLSFFQNQLNTLSEFHPNFAVFVSSSKYFSLRRNLSTRQYPDFLLRLAPLQIIYSTTINELIDCLFLFDIEHDESIHTLVVETSTEPVEVVEAIGLWRV
jgi:hypothetical protein